MATAYGNKNVDERYLAILEPNLYDNSVFVPGVTFTNKFTQKGGQLYAHKPGKAQVVKGIPGQDFVNTDTASTLVILPMDTAYRFSEKIYGAVEATTEYAVGAEALAAGIKGVSETWQQDMAAALETTTTTSVLGTAALTTANIYSSIVNDRAVLVKKGAKANVLLIDPDAYALLLQDSRFTEASDSAFGVARSGVINGVAGLVVMEYQGLGALTSYIMYDFDTLSSVTQLDMMRLKDSENFNGVLAQGEIINGIKLTNVDRALKKVHL